MTSRTVTNGAAYTTQFGYVQGSAAYGANAATPLVQSITQGIGANALNFSHTYDSRGNITSETRNGVITTYEYDALGQLTRVNDPNDPTAYNEGGLSNNGTTWVYTYDRGGNILNKAAYEFTTGPVGTAVRTWLYEYNDSNWKDKLTKFDGHTITYDAIGNPLNDGTWTYIWQAGRQLRSMSKTEGNDTITMEFTYNHAGFRTKKVKKVNDIVTETTEYLQNGKNVVELIHIDNTSGTAPTVNKLHFYYDAQGRVTLVNFNGIMYSYAKNLQGDIVGILDNTGNLVVEYKYDAWGKPISTSASLLSMLGLVNPFRYRTYVWDKETGLYYLKKRYYRTGLLRFINADSLIDQKNKNLFSYVYNNPVINEDNNGELPEKTDVRIHIYGDGRHWSIEIFGVIFSYGSLGIQAQKPSKHSADWIIVFDDVPRETALVGLNYILSNSRDDLVGSLDDVEDLPDRFKKGSKNGSWYDKSVPRDWYPYDYETHPCAAMVEQVLSEMGLLSTFETMCGKIGSSELEKKQSGSNYSWASQFVQSNNIPKGIYHICIYA